MTSPSKIPQIEKRIFKVAVLFMSSGEMSARCGFLGLLLARVRARGGPNGQTDRQRRREGRKRECEGGRYVTLAKPLSETRIYLATARWWSGVQEAAYTSVRPPTRFDSWNELSCPCYIYRQTGGMSCYRWLNTHTKTHMLSFRPRQRHVQVCVCVCACNQSPTYSMWMQHMDVFR